MFYQLPTILDDAEDYAVVLKPPCMHCAPLQGRPSDTLLDWYAAIFPPIMEISGRKEGEGGLLHRLDYETQGLVLFAKNQKAFDNLLAQQDAGAFIKEYSAICQKATTPHPSFPPPPFIISSIYGACVIESFFRPFGPGRKQVRPVTLDYPRRILNHGVHGVSRRKEQKPNQQLRVLRVLRGKILNSLKSSPDPGTLYRTEIAAFSQPTPDHYAFTVKLRRGFRHQVRCHLAWIGCPVLNDPLYGTDAEGGFLALRASGINFVDPQSGEAKEYRIAPLEIP